MGFTCSTGSCILGSTSGIGMLRQPWIYTFLFPPRLLSSPLELQPWIALQLLESFDTPAVLPVPSITSMTPAPDIPEDPREWSPQNLKDFLETKKKEFFLDDEDIIRLYREKVSDRVLLQLTKEELITSYGLPRGTAGSIELLINSLKQPQGMSTYPYHNRYLVLIFFQLS